MNPFRVLFCIVGLLGWAAAQAAPVRGAHIEVELVAAAKPLTPGANPLALRLTPDPGWHTYWRNPGDSGVATQLTWRLPDGWSAGELQWPYPQLIKLGGIVNYAYEGEVLLPVTVTAPADATGTATLNAEARWLVCSEDTCVPGTAALSLKRNLAPTSTQSRWAGPYIETQQRLPRDSGLVATFEIADGRLQLDIRGDELLAVEELRFFPYAGDLLDHAQAQSVQIGSGRARIQQKLGSAFTAAPAAVDGVLVVDGEPVRGYAIRAGAAAAPEPAAPTAASPGLLSALLLALLGGLILNLMPCVFPVLSLKALSLSQSAGDRREQRRQALAYTAGVLLSCVSVAALLLGLRAGGQALGWGFQLQSPVFVATLVYLLFALGLAMSGVWELGARWMGAGQSLAARKGLAGSFFTGVLATVVASPCTAPFMGAALGYALVQPALSALLVFAALGLGLALPFLIFGFVPAAARLLPKPGAWMERFKQLMAFPLYLTAVWLLWVLMRQSGADAAAVILCGSVALAFAAWAATHGGRAFAALGLIAALLLLLHPAIRTPVAATSAVIVESGTEPYSDARFDELRAAGQPLFVNFTADWCLTCKANERLAIGRDEVQAAFKQADVMQLIGDWTNSDPTLTAVLARHGRAGVPLYLWVAPGAEPEVLPQILTPGLLLDLVDG